jgi:hypothetical protein
MFVEPIKESPVMSLLRSLNVEVVPVQASSWADCYMIAVGEIEKRIRANPELLPIPSRENYAYEEYTPPTRAARPKTSQVSFKFMTAPRKPSAKKPS